MLFDMQPQMYPYKCFALLISLKKSFLLFITPHCSIVSVKLIYYYMPDPKRCIKTSTPHFCQVLHHSGLVAKSQLRH